MLLRIPEGTTGAELYRMIAGRVARLLKAEAKAVCLRGDHSAGSADTMASLAPPVPPPEDPSSGEEAAVSSQEAHAGNIPQFGFRLREVSSDGIGDPKAHWLTRSVGRLIPSDSSEAVAGGLTDGACIAIDWHLAIHKGWFDSSLRFCMVDRSMDVNRSMEDRALTLDKCLDTFSAEEKISDVYCSKCKELRNASLKTEFWRLPPVLVVRLPPP